MSSPDSTAQRDSLAAQPPRAGIFLVGAPSSTRASRAPSAPAALAPEWLKVGDIAVRWSCSRATVYRAIGDMERGGYLRRMFLPGGSDQRIALGSVETWERLHSAAPGSERAAVATMRRKPARKAPGASSAPATGPGLREQWRRMRDAA